MSSFAPRPAVPLLALAWAVPGVALRAGGPAPPDPIAPFGRGA